MKFIVPRRYVQGIYSGSIKFELPCEGEAKSFYYNKQYITEKNAGYEISCSDTFLFTVRNSEGREERSLSATSIKEYYDADEEYYKTRWTVLDIKDGIVKAVGDDIEEYIAGGKDVWDIDKQNLQVGDSIVLRDKKLGYLSFSEAESDFWLNTLSEIKDKENGTLYIKYLQKLKSESGLEDWYDFALNLSNFDNDSAFYKNKFKIEDYRNDFSYEKTTPFCLRERKQFIVWKWSISGGRATKIPMNPWNVNKGASSTDRNTWATFDKCCEVARKYGKSHSIAGIGIMFGRGLMGIDFDHCIKDGVLDPEKEKWVKKINSYTEYSPSGDGLHILVFSDMPEGYGNKNDEKGIEVYSQKRFFTLSGKVYDKHIRMPKKEVCQEAVTDFVESNVPKKPVYVAPPAVNLNFKDEEVIRLIRNGARARAFEYLYDKGEVPCDRNGLLSLSCMKLKNESGGVPSGIELDSNEKILKYYEKDHSRCDTALCGILASYCGSVEQMNRIFRTSALMREKWDKSRGDTTYGNLLCDYAFKSAKWRFNPDMKAKKQQEILE